MMFSLPAEQVRLFELQAGYAAQVVVWLQDAGGTWRCLNAMDGRNWVEAVSWGEGVDQAVTSADVQLRRDVYQHSLAPGVAASRYNQLATPLLWPGRRISIQARLWPLSVQPTLPAGPGAQTGWLDVFEGHVDAVDWASPAATLQCRDLGGRLQDLYIREERSYSNTGLGSPIGQIIQQILDDACADNGIEPISILTLNGSDAHPRNPADETDWTVFQIGDLDPVKKQPILEILNKLLAQIGWIVRYRWHDNAGGWRLTAYEPDREKVVPDVTLGTWQYSEVGAARLDVAEIVNHVRVYFHDRDAPPGDWPDQKTPPLVYSAVSNDESIAKYGLRYAQIPEAASSEISTYAEATRMAVKVLGDLAEPYAAQAVGCYFAPHLQAGDLVRFLPNGVHFDSDQDLAVVEARHTVSATDARTELTCRGRPVSRHKGWTDGMSRSGGAPSTLDSAPRVQTPTLVQQEYRSALFRMSDSRTGLPVPTIFEVHAGAAAGFVPSDGTYLGDMQGSQFTVHGLAPGVAGKWIKVVGKDSKGRRSAPSAAVYAEGEAIGVSALEPAMHPASAGLGLSADAPVDPEGTSDIVWDTQTWGTGSIGADTDTGEIVIQAAGQYRVTGQARIVSPANETATANLAIFVNGNPTFVGPMAAVVAGTLTATVNTVLSLGQSDAVTLRLLGSDLDETDQIQAANSYFNAERLPG
jgi:hypothetical protein